MGFLDSVIGAVSGAAGSAAGGQQVQGGTQAALLNLVVSMLANPGQGQPAQGGGLAGALGGLGGLGGLVGRLQQGGLGEVASSWIGTGHNLPISAEQLQSVLGSDVVAQIAQHLGVSHGEAAGQLSHLLPQVVDHLTPNGTLPEADGDAADGGLAGIGDMLAKFGQR